MSGGPADVGAALDATISDAAASAFVRATRGLNNDEKARRVSAALDSLHGSIRRLRVPAYDDPMVPLFYSVWYQPFQINAACSLFGSIIEQRQSRLASTPRLQIVDFGSGALAMEIGLAIAALDARRQGLTVPHTSVSLFEPSDAMTRMGLALWQGFLNTAGYESSLDEGSGSATARLETIFIDLQRMNRACDVETGSDYERWLVAMHAYYGERKDAIRRDLSQIRDFFRPGLGLFTCHHAGAGGIEYVAPFTGPPEPTDIPALRLSGELPRVNQWRRDLAGELGLQDDTRLTRPTEWDPERGLRDNRAFLFQ